MVEKAQGARGAPTAASDSDPPGQARIARIGAQPLLGAERQVALNRQAQPAAHRRQFAQADPADFRRPQAQVAKTKGVVVVIGINLGQ